ncbi:MAG: DUF1501 domain-containing protein [Planctomycetia bacterium]|nr:DUF1501 domain-containing protein [Planctomycetia bacterium]
MTFTVGRPNAIPQHPRLSRRCALQAGALGLVGLGINHLEALRAAPVAGAKPSGPAGGKARSVIYIFLSGGLAQHDSFDMKPEAPAEIRGEFQPIATNTPGLSICEHLPRLAQRSHLWAVCRSLSHPSNDHSAGHHIMLTGRTMIPPGFNPSVPMPSDWPSLPSIVGGVTQPRNNLPPAVVLPEKLIHYSRRVIPGQFGGEMGAKHDPWFIESSPYNSLGYGAYPEYEFDHQERPNMPRRTAFQAPDLTLPEGFGGARLVNRLQLLGNIDRQRADLERFATIEQFDRTRQGAISLLTDRRIREAIDVTATAPEVQERYGKNSFGWSLLMARRLVEAGVNLVQVNLGNNETWDTHGEAFPHLKDLLFPPTDKALSALLDDLNESGLLDSTLIVMAGEFGRTPKVTHLPQHYKLPGRDHWGPVQSVFFAGGGVRGGTVVGSSDKIGAFPATHRQTPENMAATMYHSLGLPDTVAWHDELNRPHHLYYGEPILGLL